MISQYFATIQKKFSSNATEDDQWFLRPIIQISSPTITSGRKLELVNKDDFKNCGSIKMLNGIKGKLDKSLENYCDEDTTFLIISIDSRNLRTNDYYNPDNPNSPEYVIFDNAIMPQSLPLKNFIEIIDSPISIDDLIKDESRRIIELHHRPLNKRLIFLRWNGFIYGPFETKVENNSYNYILSSYEKNFCIYCFEETLINDEIYSFEFQESTISFIYSIDRIINKASNDRIDFISNVELIDHFKSLLKKNLQKIDIHKIQNLLENADHEDKTIYPSRLNKYLSIIQSEENLIENDEDLKNQLVSAILGNENTINIISDYIVKNHWDWIEKHFSSTDNWKSLQTKKIALEAEVEAAQNELNDMIQKSEIKKQQLLNEERQEREKETAAYRAEVETLKRDIERYKQERQNALHDYATADRDKEKAIEDFRHGINDAILNVSVNEMSAKLFYNAVNKHNEMDGVQNIYTTLDSNRLKREFSAETIINQIANFFSNANRPMEKNDIINILICLTQGFITVFAGEPGTGKTSLCNLLAKSLGLSMANGENRYIEVSVERGWTL